jgi:hypothetical protein
MLTTSTKDAFNRIFEPNTGVNAFRARRAALIGGRMRRDREGGTEGAVAV